MQFNQIKFLLAVEQYGSISKAAQELFISQSTVSLALINLEEELGVSILNRGKRGVSFTPQGNYVLERAHTIMAEMEKLEHMADLEEIISGEVRVGGNKHFCMNIITDAMMDSKRQFENVQIIAQRDNRKDIIKKLVQKEYDLALLEFDTITEADVKVDLQRNQLEFHPLFTDKVCICVGENHPLRKQKTVTYRDLSPYNWATAYPKSNEFMAGYLRQQGLESEVVNISEISNLRRYAHQMNCFMIMPEMEVENSNAQYEVKIHKLNVEGFDVTGQIGWVHHGAREMTVAEQKFVEVLERECNKYQAKYGNK